ncbi:MULTISPECIES: DUF6516 family protein [unclassified Serratia (in: enterobacteria)]|uniref:toxin-antitoxin system TumE family protein n=1 Tax=unclassified Serratia (in: enterobacteria) TaxID=2647522 RepID=UPI00046A071E|nr:MULTISPECIES: DUF6516 family protein [unclassified Serratia (in: enterobacteria)]
MPSQLVFQDRITLTDTEFVQMVIWFVEPSVRASVHHYKYRFAYVKDGICRLRYDNEAGKGDHKHLGDKQQPIKFTSPKALIRSFFDEVAQLREDKR